MAWYEVRTFGQAVKTYAVYGALCFLMGMYRGCDVGYNNGYQQAVQDIQRIEKNDSRKVEPSLEARLKKR
ncbi:MAG: hypothetical protein ACOCWQ_04240 [Nanoarchaeota archaeon]